MMKIIERLTTFAVLVAALVVITATVRDRLFPDSAPTQAGMLNAAQKLVGKTFPIAAKYPTGKAATLVLVVAEGCHYCSESMPFYQRLTGMKTRTPGDLDIVALVPQPASQGRKYVSENQLEVDDVVSGSLAKVGLPATPTLVLLDSNRQVAAVWVGLLDARHQADVLKKLGELCPNCQAA